MNPNFFIIGAPKSGTTAISEYLGEHPALFMCRPKEPKYFDKDLTYKMTWTPQTYLALFQEADPTRHRAVGEASVTYLYSQCAVDNILEFNPDAKFIVMLRNPLELIQSWHSQQIYTGQEDIQELEDAWKAEADRKAGARIPFSCHEPKMLFYSEIGMLGEQVERLLKKVDRQRVLFLLFDNFSINPERSYEEVLAFLGLPSDGRKNFPVVNENKGVRWPLAQRWLSFGLDSGRRVKSWLGIGKFETGIFRTLMWINGEKKKRKNLSSAFENELRDFFQDDVNKLSDLLDRDLSHWIGGTQ